MLFVAARGRRLALGSGSVLGTMVDKRVADEVTDPRIRPRARRQRKRSSYVRFMEEVDSAHDRKLRAPRTRIYASSPTFA